MKQDELARKLMEKIKNKEIEAKMNNTQTIGKTK